MSAKKMKQNRLLSILLLGTMFLSVLSPVIMAIGMDKGADKYICGMKEHVHSDACIEDLGWEFACLEEDSEDAFHEHTSECYDKDGALICLPAVRAAAQDGTLFHEHSKWCYDEANNLVCPLEERIAHVHTDDCYATTMEVPDVDIEGDEQGGQDADEPSQADGEEESGSDGATSNPEDGVASDDGAEGEQGADLEGSDEEDVAQDDTAQESGAGEEQELETDEPAMAIIEVEPYLICTLDEVKADVYHEHTEDCMKEIRGMRLVCGMEEHIHTEECEPPVMDELITDEVLSPSDTFLSVDGTFSETTSAGVSFTPSVKLDVVAANYEDDFCFTISPAEDYPGLIMTEDDMVMLQGAGTVEFGTIGFTEAGTYKFIIEQAGGIENYRYDDRTWELTVTVTSDGGAPAGAIGGHYDVSKYDVPVDKNKDGWITQSEFDARIEELKVQYPAGTLWNDASIWGTDRTAADGYVTAGGLHSYTSKTIGGGTGCAAWAKLLSDRIFGNFPWREFTDAYSMRSGDIVWDKSTPHWMVYLNPSPYNSNYVQMSESGSEANSKISWNSYSTSLKFSDVQDAVNAGIDKLYTRYPEGSNTTEVLTASAEYRRVSDAMPETSTESAHFVNTCLDVANWDSATIAQANKIMEGMSLEEKAGQLILFHYPGDGSGTAAKAAELLDKYHFGGYLVFAAMFENSTPAAVQQKIADTQAASRIPLLFTVDEEGGTTASGRRVVRISQYPQYGHDPFKSPSELKASGGLAAVAADAVDKAAFLKNLGLNVNHAPVADLAETDTAYMYGRAWQGDGLDTAKYVETLVEASEGAGMPTTMKHFPGYGATSSNTHNGFAVNELPMENFLYDDLLPFQAGMAAGSNAVMVTHNTINAFDTENPSSLAPEVYRFLRQEMNFNGVAMTDDLAMGAITNHVGAGNASLRALQAGADMAMTSSEADVQTVMAAAQSGTLSLSDIETKCRRVLCWKIEMGLIEEEAPPVPGEFEAKYIGAGSEQEGSFADMWALAAANGGKVELYKDVSFSDALSVPTARKVELDLRGFELAYTGTGNAITVQGTFTLSDSVGVITDEAAGGSGASGYANRVLLYNVVRKDGEESRKADFTAVGALTGSGASNLVYVNGGTFNLENGVLENASGHGAATSAMTASTVNINGGAILGSGAAASDGQGGGVSVAAGRLNMSGGYIAGNTVSTKGGGVYLNNSTECYITGGVIAHNNGGINGGGVYANTSVRLSIRDAVLTGNRSSSNGGNIYGVTWGSAPNITIEGESSVCYGQSGNGGGIYPSKQLTIGGNTVIAKNNASGNGGGVYGAGGVLNVQGSPAIRDNTGKDGSDNLWLPTGSKLTVSGALSGADIRVLTQATDAKIEAAAPASGVSMDGAAACFTPDREGYTAGVEGQSVVFLFGAANYEAKYIAADGTAETGTFGEMWAKAMANGGKVELYKNVSFASTLNVLPSKPVELDLRGKTLTYTGTGNGVRVMANASFTLSDSIGNIRDTIQGNVVSSGYSNKYLLFNDVEKIVETGHQVDFFSAGSLFAEKSSNLIYVEGGTFNLKGGVVENTSGTNAIGTSTAASSIINMDGGAVLGSKRGVYVNNGSFNMTNGYIAGNTSGGIRLNGSSTGAISGGVIACNQLTGMGAGVYVSTNSKLSLSNTNITGNTATAGGGNVYVDGGTVSISGNTSISYGSATNGAGVYAASSANISLQGTPVVKYNSSSTGANNIYLVSGNALSITGALTSGTDVRVTTAADTGANITVATAASGVSTTGFDELFSSDRANYHPEVSGQNVIFAPGAPTVSYEAKYTSEDGQDEQFGTFAAMWAMAAKSSGTVQILKDAAFNTTQSVSGSGKNVVVDLNGKTLTYTGSYLALNASSGSTITVTDTSGRIYKSKVEGQTTPSGYDAANRILEYADIDINGNASIYRVDFNSVGVLRSSGNTSALLYGADKNTTIVLENGCIENATGSIEAIHADGSFNMTGGAILNSRKGGISSSNNTTSIQISGGYVVGNKGTGIYASDVNSVKISNVVVAYNDSQYTGGGIYLGTSNVASNVELSNVVITGNTSDSSGGGISIGSNTGNGSSAVNVQIENSSISYNTASSGAGIYSNSAAAKKADITLSNSIIAKNKASSAGGGASISSSVLTLKQKVSFEENEARTNGGINVGDNCQMILSGNPQVKSNSSTSSTASSNMNLPNDTAINVVGSLQDEAILYIWTAIDTSPVLVATVSSGNATEADAAHFVPERSGYSAVVYDGKVAFSTTAQVTIPVVLTVDGTESQVGTITNLYGTGPDRYIRIDELPSDLVNKYTFDKANYNGSLLFGIKDATGNVTVYEREPVKGEDGWRFYMPNTVDVAQASLVFLPNGAFVGTYTPTEITASNGLWSVTVNDVLGVTEEDVEKVEIPVQYVPAGLGLKEPIVLPERGQRWPWTVNEHTSDEFECEMTESSGIITVVLRNVHAPVVITSGVSTDTSFTVQYYANMTTLHKGNFANGANSLKVIDTTRLERDSQGRRLPQNRVLGDDMPQISLDIQADGSIAEDNVFLPIYQERQTTYFTTPSIRMVDKLLGKDNYELSELWILKSNRLPDSTNREDWTIYSKENMTGISSLYDLILTNQPGQVTDSNVIYIENNTVIRFVYNETNNVKSTNASFYDYDIGDGYVYTGDGVASNSQKNTSYQSEHPTDTLYMSTNKKGINSIENYGGSSDKKFAFGNANTDTGWQNERIDGYAFNAANRVGGWNTPNLGFEKCTFGLVTGLGSDGNPIFRDGIVAPKLFGTESAIGKTYVGEYELNFNRRGDTYTLQGVTGTPAQNLDKFSTHSSVWSNLFWPMDAAETWGADGHDMKWGDKPMETYRRFTGDGTHGKGSMFAVSDDLVDHNSYFSMNFSIDFALSEGYTGPLEYCFFGDDDIWMFLDGKLILDIGGVHSSVGEYINLWDYIEVGDTSNHTLQFFYIERGASGSSCWMQFTIPEVTFSSGTGGNTDGSLKIEKSVVGYPTGSRSFDFQLSLLNSDGSIHDGNYIYVVRETSTDEMIDRGVVYRGELDFNLSDDEYILISGLPVGTSYRVTEANYNCDTTYSVDGGATITSSTLNGTITKGQTITVKCINDFSSHALFPATGGPGFVLWYCIASSLIFAASTCGYLNLRKQRKTIVVEDTDD